MLAYLDKMVAELEATKEKGDIEAVHQARVASRRTRAAMATFRSCFPKEDWKVWNKRVRAVTRSLGEARDLDVQIELLKDFSAKRGDVDLSALILDFQQRRDRAHPSVVLSVDEFHSSGTEEGMRSFLVALTGEIDDVTGAEVQGLAGKNYRKRRKEVMEWEGSLDNEEEKEGHHQLRIAMKRLRYTLEIFEPTFEHGLKEQIKVLKGLQDLLGEIHDCDVWVMELEGRQRSHGEEALLQDRKERRADLFASLLMSYEELRDNGFFEHLDTIMNEGEKKDRESPPLTRERPPEVIAIVSDVHGNLPALEAVINDAAAEGATYLLNAGDSVGLGEISDRTLERLAGPRFFNVLGNIDLSVLDVAEGKSTIEAAHGDREEMIRLAAASMSEGSKAFLIALPRSRIVDLDGRKVYLSHAGPFSIEERWEEGMEEGRLQELVDNAKADLIIVGHTHKAWYRNRNDTLIINPGSIGQQIDGDPRASYALFWPKEMRVELRRIPYPIHRIADEVMAQGMPPRFLRSYLLGKGELPGRRPERLKTEAVTKRIENVVRSYGYLDLHTLKVRSLALVLFHDLQEMHGLGKKEGRWLEWAALLHDIGWIWGGPEHNESSFDLILCDERLPLSRKERLMVASIARYHRRRGPRAEDGNMALLRPKERDVVMQLASILRIADSLDSRHRQVVDILGVEVEEEAVYLHLDDLEAVRPEVDGARKKGGLFEEVFHKELRFI